MRSIRRGDHGEEVRDVQSRLAGLGHRVDQAELEEGRFESSTDAAVRAFQQQRGLLVDGLVGPETWQELVEAGYTPGERVLYLRYPYFRGDDVRALQARLDALGFDPGRQDGIFGQDTGRAVRDFQRNVGLAPDGIVGTTTLQALERLRPALPGPGRAGVRESEGLREGQPLRGRVVAVDAGHGAGDPGAVGPTGLTEVAAALSIAEELAAELSARGATPALLRGPHEDPTPGERARRANEAGADVLVSLHINSHDDPRAEGTSSYYFGRLGFESVAGRALAELMQELITARLGLRDGRAHPKAFPLLRETQMPALHLEPCFITNPGEERMLRDDGFRRELVAAIVDGLELFFAERPAQPVSG